MNFHNPTPGLDRQAFFFDFDGTLADIAPRPQEVVLPPRRRDNLLQLWQRTGGAVAVLSGRARADLAALVPEHIPLAGLHGWDMEDEAGSGPDLKTPMAKLDGIRQKLIAVSSQFPGSLLEDKGTALALHWRLAPDAEDALRRAAEDVANALGPDWTLQPGKCVVEIRPTGGDKGDALRRFMQRHPFKGRSPIAAGDDLTDIPMLQAAQAAGGTAIAIGERDLPCDLRLATPADLALWIERSLLSA